MTQDTEDVVARVAKAIEFTALHNINGQICNSDDVARAALEASDRQSLSDPISMLLYCPQCGQHHVDEPDERTPDWTNPPHRSHLCHDCGCIWRPADVPTTGVRAIQTRGKADTWTADRGNAEPARAALHQEATAP